jgi:hypothetical protein
LLACISLVDWLQLVGMQFSGVMQAHAAMLAGACGYAHKLAGSERAVDAAATDRAGTRVGLAARLVISDQCLPR